MEVVSQAPQPTIKCYHSISRSEHYVSGVSGVYGRGSSIQADDRLYQTFSPASRDIAGKNLQSYSFDSSIENFGGSFSFTIKEDIPDNVFTTTFMDEVEPLDIVEISENGTESRVDFIGVVTKVSVGGMSSNLTKTVTVSGRSIEWLFTYFTINTDIKACIPLNGAANNTFKLDLANENGEKPTAIKDIVVASLKTFNEYAAKVNEIDGVEISNIVIGQIIKKWYGDNFSDFVEATDDDFYFPISSNLFDTGKINVIDFIRKLLPSPIYEIFGFIDDNNKPKLCVRSVPFDNPESTYKIKPVLLTDFTLTRSCEEVYTAFMPYIEGSSMSPDFYMNLAAAQAGKEKGYNASLSNPDKVKIYGYQLLTCSFVGYSQKSDSPEDEINSTNVKGLTDKMNRWFGKLDEMYDGDFTLVNIVKDRMAKKGEWIGFADGLFYVYSESHSWNFGDNPMINYQVGRGGKWINGEFSRIEKLSAVYREFD